MTFLNPLVLFGLAASALPLLLHLLNLRRLRTVEFSSVRLLKELQKTSMRRVRFRQILLLILRTLLIAAIVLAFSRPALRASLAGFAGSGASSTMAVIVDDSPSMEVRDERGSAFARAAEAAGKITALAREGDRLYLLPLSELRPDAPLPSPRSAESAREALARMVPTMISVPLPAALRRIAPLLASAADANREVVFASDGQATQLLPPPGLPDSALVPEGVRVFFCFSPPLHTDNTGATGGETLTRLISLRKPVRYRASVSNTGSGPVRGSVLSLYLDGARAAELSTDIPPRGVSEPVFSFTAKRRGLLAGRVQLEDDAFAADNAYHFVLDVPEHIGVLLCGPDSASTRLAALALTLGGDSLIAGDISASRTVNAALPGANLSGFDVIMMCGSGGLSAEGARRVAQFAAAGGGLILFPGDEPPGVDSTLAQALGAPPPAGPPFTAPGGSFLTFSTLDYAHPLFEGMFESARVQGGKKPEVESPRIAKAARLRAGEKGITVIGLGNGDAFLVDRESGAGRVLQFAVEAGTGWSDFPLKGLFAPLLHRAVVYTGSRPPSRGAIAPGDPLTFTVRLRTFTDRDTYTVTLPDGNTRKAAPEFHPAAGTAAFHAGSAPEPGVYRLARDAGEGGGRPHDLSAIAVNLAPGESDLATATDAGIEQFRVRAHISAGALEKVSPASVVATVEQARYGIELWKECVMLALMLALAEMAVGRVPSGKASAGEGRTP